MGKDGKHLTQEELDSVNEMAEKGGSAGVGIEMNDFLTGGTGGGDAAYPLTLTSIGFQLYLRSP